ncbi:MAG: hypothetical protein P8Y36_11980 [Alphaproteobacteria bacterium]
MTKRYEKTRIISSESMTLIFPEGTYDALPFEVRMLGPWFGCSYGNMASLKSAWRTEISRKGYMITREAPGMLDAA